MDEKKKNITELLNYIVVGGLVTPVNFIVYFSYTHMQLHYLVADVTAQILVVLLAYIANRKYVSKSEGSDQKAEFLQFVSLHAVTLVTGSLLLFVCIQLATVNESIAKVFISIATTIGNYIFCKFIAFKPKTRGQ